MIPSPPKDRLLHHCRVLELDGNSFRNPPRPARLRGRPDSVTSKHLVSELEGPAGRRRRDQRDHQPAPHQKGRRREGHR